MSLVPTFVLAPLIDALDTFAPHDATEADARARILTLIKETAAPRARRQFDPGHLTASAFVLTKDHDALLMIHHAKLQRWLQPGGHLEPGEFDLALSARREAKEETGVKGLKLLNAGLPFDLDVHDIPANPRKSEPGHAHFDVRFLFVASKRNVVAASDAELARFVPLDEVTGLNGEAGLLRVLEKLASPSPGLFSEPPPPAADVSDDEAPLDDDNRAASLF